MILDNYTDHQLAFIIYIIGKYPSVNSWDLKTDRAIGFDVWQEFAQFPKLYSVNEGMFVAHGYQTYYIYNQKTNQIFYSEAVTINPVEKLENKKIGDTIKSWKNNAVVAWT